MFGEHAVVYGRPAIAVPLHALQVTASLQPATRGERGKLWVEAHDVGFAGWVALRPIGEPAVLPSGEGTRPPGHAADAQVPSDPTPTAVDGLALAVQLGLQHFQAMPDQALHLRVDSAIPVAAGMGSSAALSVAILRAVAEHLDRALPPEQASELAYQVERYYHGTPSGIDNAVVAHGLPIYFQLGSDPRPLATGAPFTLVLADSGRPSPTRQMVEGVRNRWEADRGGYERHFDAIGELVERAGPAIESGEVDALGPLMDENQRVLERIGVSTTELEALIGAAREAGAQGAKLSGAGGGGLVLALVDSAAAPAVERGLKEAGAVRTFVTEIGQ